VVSRGENLRRVKRYAMNVRSSNILRRKNSENKILLDSELQETEKHYDNTTNKHPLQQSHNNPCESFNHEHSISDA
jgi:hypothetical protein